jgi:hypothetical protein
MRSTTNEFISRVLRSKKEAGIGYSKISKWYDMAASFESKFKEKGLQNLDVKEGEKVLEIRFEKVLEEAGFQCVDAAAISMWGLPAEIFAAQKV